jgi:hypothetical protein
MARVNLQLSLVEAFIRFKAKEGYFVPKIGFIDTGAPVSLFPLSLLDDVEYKIIDSDVEIEQAGIAGQHFTGVEAQVRIYFEDLQGNVSQERDIRAWFADTDKIILDFKIFWRMPQYLLIFAKVAQAGLNWISFLLIVVPQPNE